jgi:hypothetical protein
LPVTKNRLISELKEAIGFEIEIEERGALDDLTYEEVKGLYLSQMTIF